MYFTAILKIFWIKNLKFFTCYIINQLVENSDTVLTEF